jgi:hypothetical protein
MMRSDLLVEVRVNPARAETLAVGAVLCVVTGLLVAHDDTGVLLGMLIIVALVAVGARDGRLLLVSVLLASLLHFPIGNFRAIANVQIAEVAAPFLLGGFLLRASLRRVTRSATAAGLEARNCRRGTSEPNRARWLHRAVFVYGLVIVANLLRSALLLNTSHAWRPMYAYLVGLSVYFLAYRGLWRGTEPKSADRVRLLLSAGYALSVFVCALGVLAVLLHLPLNLGNLRFSVYSLSSGAVRVGFLDTFGSMGLALAIAGVGGRTRFPAGLLFAAAVVASGGRSAAIGITLGILAYLILSRRTGALVFVAVLVSLVTIVAFPSIQNTPQLRRLTDVSQSAVSSDQRAPFLSEALREFRRRPLIGTGMGVPSSAVLGTTWAEVTFNRQQLEYGGQATYHSLLKLFGLAGFLPFVAALIFAVTGLGRRVRRSVPAAFLFMFAVAQTVSMIAGGDGSDPQWFFTLGAAAALLTWTDGAGAELTASRLGQPPIS